MTKLNFRLSTTVLAALLSILFSLSSTSAQEELIEIVTLETSDALRSAQAIVLFPPNKRDADSQKRPAKLSRRNDKQWEARVQLRAEDRVPGALLAVVALSSKGAVVSSPLRFLDTPKSSQSESIQCADDSRQTELNRLLQLDEEALSTLKQIRETKLGILRKRIHRLLTKQAIHRLTTTEKELGLYFGKPLSADLPPAELSTRLGKIEAVRGR